MIISGHSKQVSIRSRLVALVLVSIFPVLIFAGTLAVFLTFRQMDSVERGIQGTTKALTEVIDRQVSTVIAALQILTETEDFELEGKELRILHQKLRRTIINQTDWLALSYSDKTGVQIFNTSRPFGEVLPPLTSETFYKDAIAAKKISISGFRRGLVTKTPIISIVVPVFRKKELKFLLVASIDIKALSKTLEDQNLPSSWTASVIDRNSKIIARSRNIDEFLGKDATPKLASLIRSFTDSIFEDKNLEGTISYGAFNRSELTGWTIVIGAPRSDFINETLHTFWIILIGAVVFVGLGITFAFLVGSRISKPILALSEQAKALGSGEVIGDIDTNLHEVLEVSSALKKAALEREASDEKAIEAIKLRDTFLSVASHELKTPITALQLNLQMLNRNLSKHPEGDKFTNSFSKSLYQVSRLTNLVNELLDVSAITAGKMRFHYEQMNLNALIFDIVGRYVDNSISINVSQDINGNWDKSRLEQVLTNLISNAVKYGEGKPIVVTLEQVDKEVTIKVKDQGKGINKEDQVRIFQKFERAVEGPGISGLGLGLWISDQIVTGLNGYISVDSTPGEGSTFIVTIPA